MKLYEELNIPEDKDMFPTSISFNYAWLVEENNWHKMAHNFKSLLNQWYEHGLLNARPVGVMSYRDEYNINIEVLFEPTEYMNDCIDRLQEKWHVNTPISSDN